ncbi:acyltransferase [Micromonospora sp. NPDC007271]|uniref:acyltransferase family protein n=1 Tax=Micromonospora sp. NPDC007271 TaxID=3154587 RepID=UPI0033E78D2A
MIRSAAPRLHVLDLLRFFAAMFVMGFHLIPIVAFVYGLDADAYFGHVVAQAFRYGWMGVDFFFIISGFVICMSSWGRSVGDFFTSRATRLMPAYLLAVVMTSALLTFLWPASFHPPLAGFLTNLTMVQGMLHVPDIDTVYWTLLVELKFYLLFAVVVHFGLTYRRVVLFCVSWTVAALVGQYTNNGLIKVLVEPRYAYFFVAGIVLYLMYRFGPTLLLWGMLAVSWIFCANSLRLMFSEQQVPVNLHVGLGLLTMFLAVMTAAALGKLSWLSWPGFVTIGALTYPVYLIHFYLSYTILRRLHGHVPDALLLVCTVATVLLVAYLIHRLVERRAARLLRAGIRRSFAAIRQADAPQPAESTRPVKAIRVSTPTPPAPRTSVAP